VNAVPKLTIFSKRVHGESSISLPFYENAPADIAWLLEERERLTGENTKLLKSAAQAWDASAHHARELTKEIQRRERAERELREVLAANPD
jgi:hypothetical protein